MFFYIKYHIYFSHVPENVMKKIKSEVFAVALPKEGDDELLEKIKLLKEEAKGKKKQQAPREAATQSKHPEPAQNRNKKGGKGKKK